MKYEFTNAQGRPCCKTNHLSALCGSCRSKALRTQTPSALSTPSALPSIPVADLRSLAALPNAPAYAAGLIAGWEQHTPQEQHQLLAQIAHDMAAPPEPVGIVNSLRANRGLPPIGVTPSYRGGERPTVAASAVDAPPDPPSLAAAIQSSRSR